MPDTERTDAAILSLLADNNSRDISPQDVRDAWVTLNSKAPTPISVKQFGAKGDGSTDDTVAIASALDEGQGIFFPAGTYNISATLSARLVGQGFYGAGSNLSFLVMTSDNTPILNFSGDRIHFGGLNIKYNNIQTVDHSASNILQLDKPILM